MVRLRPAISCTNGTLRLRQGHPRLGLTCLVGPCVPPRKVLHGSSGAPEWPPRDARDAAPQNPLERSHPRDDPKETGRRSADRAVAAIHASIGRRQEMRCAVGPGALPAGREYRSPVRDDDPCRHGQRLPAPTLCDLNAEASALIHPAYEFVDMRRCRSSGSMITRARRPGCQARKSMIPRSP